MKTLNFNYYVTPLTFKWCFSVLGFFPNGVFLINIFLFRFVCFFVLFVVYPSRHDTTFPSDILKYAVFTCRQREASCRYKLARETKLKCYCEKVGARDNL